MNRRLVLFALGSIAYLFMVQMIFNSLRTDDLLFILAPSAKLVSFFGDYQMEWSDLDGFQIVGKNIRIEKSCSGFVYLGMLYLLITYSFGKNWNYYKTKIHWVILSIPLAYIFVVVVNTARIITGIGIETFSLQNTWFPNKLFHEFIGIIYFLFGMSAVYLLIDKPKLNLLKYGNS